MEHESGPVSGVNGGLTLCCVTKRRNGVMVRLNEVCTGARRSCGRLTYMMMSI